MALGTKFVEDSFVFIYYVINQEIQITVDEEIA